MISGSTSAISSVLIIAIVAKSAERLRLSTTYHRIMTFMSLFEIIIASISMALATIPMHKNNVYHFSGPMLVGNFSTCAAQGYLIVLGTTNAAALLRLSI